MTQARGWGIPKYVTAQTEGPEHAKIFAIEAHVGGKCLGSGSGPSKHVAQQAAAQAALEKLETLDD
jgi:ribonuclease-3